MAKHWARIHTGNFAHRGAAGVGAIHCARHHLVMLCPRSLHVCLDLARTIHSSCANCTELVEDLLVRRQPASHQGFTSGRPCCAGCHFAEQCNLSAGHNSLWCLHFLSGCNPCADHSVNAQWLGCGNEEHAGRGLRCHQPGSRDGHVHSWLGLWQYCGPLFRRSAQ